MADDRGPTRVAFESERLSYSDYRVDLDNSGINQLLSLTAVRGAELCHFRMADLYHHEGRPMVRATTLALHPDWDGDRLDAWQHVEPTGAESFDVADIDLYFVRGDDIRRTDTPNLDVLRVAETEAIVVESVAATLSTCDKYELVVRCPEVPQPVTFAASDADEVRELIDRLPIDDDGWFVLKDRFGSGCGAQVHRLHREMPDLDHLVADFLMSYGEVLVQEYRSEVADGDLVATFVGDELVGTMRRFPAVGEWKTNASLGASEVRHELTPDQADAAWAARRAFVECRVASVDLLLSGRVLEVNAFPGGEGLLQTHGFVLADRVLDRLDVELGARATDRTAREPDSEAP